MTDGVVHLAFRHPFIDVRLHLFNRLDRYATAEKRGPLDQVVLGQ